MEAEAGLRGNGLVVQSSERGRVAAEDELHGMVRVAQSSEEVDEGSCEAGMRSPAQPCIDA